VLIRKFGHLVSRGAPSEEKSAGVCLWVSPQSIAKSCDCAKGIVKGIKGDLIGRAFGMNTKIPNIEVLRSLWRRVKKGIKVRDLKPVKDVKGGGGLTGESKPVTGGTGTADTTSTWRYVPKKKGPNPKRGAED
jgi:hypothetical protein